MAAKRAKGRKQQRPAEAGPELVPQPHGGALLTGGKPGNRGGGRPPSKVRELARLEFEKRIPTLADLADDGDQKTRDRIRALDVLAKYGLGQARGLDEEAFEAIIVECATSVQNRLRGVLSDADAEAVMRQIFEDWKGILRAHRALSTD